MELDWYLKSSVHNSESSVGYRCMPSRNGRDRLVILVFHEKEIDTRSQQQQLVESLHTVLGGNQNYTVNVQGIKILPDDQAEVVIYVVEHSPNGTSISYNAM